MAAWLLSLSSLVMWMLQRLWIDGTAFLGISGFILLRPDGSFWAWWF
jgi:hypothetical protein